MGKNAENAFAWYLVELSVFTDEFLYQLFEAMYEIDDNEAAELPSVSCKEQDKKYFKRVSYNSMVSSQLGETQDSSFYNKLEETSTTEDLKKQ